MPSHDSREFCQSIRMSTKNEEILLANLLAGPQVVVL
jgi:hypothetical protein